MHINLHFHQQCMRTNEYTFASEVLSFTLSLTLMGPSTLLTLLDILLWGSWPQQFLTFLYFLSLSQRPCYSSVSGIPISFDIHSSSGIEVFPTRSLAHESVIWSTAPNCPRGELPQDPDLGGIIRKLNSSSTSNTLLSRPVSIQL